MLLDMNNNSYDDVYRIHTQKIEDEKNRFYVRNKLLLSVSLMNKGKLPIGYKPPIV